MFVKYLICTTLFLFHFASLQSPPLYSRSSLKALVTTQSAVFSYSSSSKLMLSGPRLPWNTQVMAGWALLLWCLCPPCAPQDAQHGAHSRHPLCEDCTETREQLHFHPSLGHIWSGFWLCASCTQLKANSRRPSIYWLQHHLEDSYFI